MSLVIVEEKQGSAVFVVHFAAKPFNQLYITNKAEHLSFKSGHAVHVAKLTKANWLVVNVVLQYEFRLNTTLCYFITKVPEY